MIIWLFADPEKGSALAIMDRPQQGASPGAADSVSAWTHQLARPAAVAMPHRNRESIGSSMCTLFGRSMSKASSSQKRQALQEQVSPNMFHCCG